jgi:hypothetical protein
VKPLLCSDVEYLGELGLEDKLALVGESFALVNPMQWAEPFGLVMIEALATGTPVVATPAGSAPEILDDGVTGYLRTGTADLAAALLEAPSLDRGACREAALQRFDTERMVSDHLRVYEDLVAGRARATRRTGNARGPSVLTPVPVTAPRPRRDGQSRRSDGRSELPQGTRHLVHDQGIDPRLGEHPGLADLGAPHEQLTTAPVDE